ncbi:MAG: DUF1464 family protein [Promethearchaeota archaeon]
MTQQEFSVLGVDPGSKSWDFFALKGNEIILDTSIPSKELIQEPQKAINIIRSLESLDLMVAPSGFGLPLKDVKDLTEKDIFFTLLKFDREDQKKLMGLGEILNLIKAEPIKAVIVPGVKHLPTVPNYRKINKVDMGTADKLCTAVVGIRDQTEANQIEPEKSNFIMVDSNIMGFRACGSLDGELAYLIKKIHKESIYKGGVASIAGFSDLSLKEITLLAENDEQVKTALKAYISSVKKAVFGISSSFSKKDKIKEILLAGRGANLRYIEDRIEKGLNNVAPVRIMKTYSQIAKRAAQGATFIANGLLGGKFKQIVNNLKIKDASGSILDNIFIPFDKDKLLSDLD